MIPTRHDYYKRRAREHRHLAATAAYDEDREMHERLVDAYTKLARKHGLRQVVTLKPVAIAAEA